MVILSIISLTTTIIVLWFLGEKKPSGFLIFTGSLLCQMVIFYMQKNWFFLLCQMVIFYMQKNWFLVAQMLVLIAFNIYNYRKWKAGG